MKHYQQSKVFSTIQQQVDKINIYSLLQSGCPIDEFNIEAKMIYDKLGKGMDTNQIATIMCDVFTEMFDDSFNLEMFIESAKIIEYELNKQDF